MNYALTIQGTVITGVHECLRPITPETFENSLRYAGQDVMAIPARGTYRTGMDIRCYEKDGTLKDELWCIQQGYMALPPGKEIIEGKLVDVEIPETEAEETVKQILLSLRSEIAGLKEGLSAQSAKVEQIEQKLNPIEPIKEVSK